MDIARCPAQALPHLLSNSHEQEKKGNGNINLSWEKKTFTFVPEVSSCAIMFTSTTFDMNQDHFVTAIKNMALSPREFIMRNRIFEKPEG